MTGRLGRALSEIAVTFGVVVLLFVVYQTWVTDLFADQAQDRISQGLLDDWAGGKPSPTEPAFGHAFAFIHIPKFGESWTRAVVEGTDPDELKEAPGHYAGSAMPGEIGNFALAGHRVGSGSPFLDLDELQTGDPVVVETQDRWFVYRVTGSEVVPPTDTSVVNSVPRGASNAIPTDAYLTLTTCTPKFTARDRLVVHALLQSTAPKSEEPDGPPELQETT